MVLMPFPLSQFWPQPPESAPVTTAAASTGAVGIGLLIMIIVVALCFDFLNGFHDAANSIATVVSTRVLSPTQAVIWAACFNFLAAFLIGTKVAETISGQLINVDLLGSSTDRVHVIFAGLLAAIIWNIITWILALPTSSSHALIAGFAGAAIAKAGLGVIKPARMESGHPRHFPFPAAGLLLRRSQYDRRLLDLPLHHPHPCRRPLPQIATCLGRRLFSIGHGANDAQKTMGIIAMLLTAGGNLPNSPPPTLITRTTGPTSLNFMGHKHQVAWWIILTCNAAMALGTIFGGWRIVKTMGSGITRLQPVGGFCAETAAATTINRFPHQHRRRAHLHHSRDYRARFSASARPNPYLAACSPGSPGRRRIVMAWILTIPCAAFLAAVAYILVNWALH